MQSLIVAIFAGIGWAAGFFLGGSHEWGWRVALLVVLWVVAVSVRLANGPTGETPK